MTNTLIHKVLVKELDVGEWRTKTQGSLKFLNKGILDLDGYHEIDQPWITTRLINSLSLIS